MKTDGNILPPPTLIVQKRKLKGAEIAVVIVHPSDAPPVRCKGRIWIRVGPRRGIASVQDERILNEKRRYRDVFYEMHPVARASLSDLNKLLFEYKYLPGAFAQDVLDQNHRSYEQRLAVSGMIEAYDSPLPTVLGLLALGNTPRSFLSGAYIQFLRMDGNEFSDAVIDEELVDGDLARLISRIDEKLAAHNRVHVDITSGPVEKRTYHYPLDALQQIVRNAVMHRTYEGANAPVRVYWFNNRIEIISLGGPFGAITPSNFGTAGLADYRNPRLADTMKVLGFVQRFGVGIQIAQRSLQENGNPPIEFAVDQNWVKCIFHIHPRMRLGIRSSKKIGRAGRALDAAYGVLLSGEEEVDITDYFIESAFPTRVEVRHVIEALEASPAGLSVPELMASVNLSKGRIEKTIALLSLESPAPIAKQGTKWQLTAANLSESFWQRAERLTTLRRGEQQQMQDYVNLTSGHMAFLRRTSLPIEPRKQWPAGGMPQYLLRGRIAADLQTQPGKALCIWGDAGWGAMVRQGKYRDYRFLDELVEVCVRLVREWNPHPAPAWVTGIPSLRHPGLVPDFARRLAAALSLPFEAVMEKTDHRPEQKAMANSTQQARNIDGSLVIRTKALRTTPVLLVDDMVDSRWTLTVAAWLLRSQGCGAVWPLALAQAGNEK